METTNANKPAYPTNARMHSDAMGLTKRELFAMAAMQGILSATGKQGYVQYDEISVARNAIIMSDALLEQLNKTSE